MNELRIILYLGVAVLSVISLFSYISKKGKMKTKQNEMLNQIKPSRILNSWEKDIFTSFYKKKLNDLTNVYKVSGKIEFIEIKVNHAPIRSYFINGIAIHEGSINRLNKKKNGKLFLNLKLEDEHSIELVFPSGKIEKGKGFPVSINDWNLQKLELK